MNDKRLAEYVEVCLHEWKKIPSSAEFDEMSGEDIYDYVCPLCNESYEEPVHKYNLFNYDFTTPDGWQKVADKIKEMGEWDAFYFWLQLKAISEAAKTHDTARKFVYTEGCIFHELPPSEKSAIFIEWLEEKAS